MSREEISRNRRTEFFRGWGKIIFLREAPLYVDLIFNRISSSICSKHLPSSHELRQTCRTLCGERVLSYCNCAVREAHLIRPTRAENPKLCFPFFSLPHPILSFILAVGYCCTLPSLCHIIASPPPPDLVTKLAPLPPPPPRERPRAKALPPPLFLRFLIPTHPSFFLLKPPSRFRSSPLL